MTEKNFYITTTLPYVNAPLHMGHALEFVRADAIARYKTLRGYNVFFNTGTDEHGLKIFERAQDEGMAPQKFVDESFAKFKESVKIFGIMPEAHFIRTTEERHVAAAQEFWKRCAEGKDENGQPFIYKKNYQAKYCVGCEEEKSDSELESGECPLHPGRPLEIIEEENYFFRYSSFKKKLSDFYNDPKHKDFVVPDFRFNEVKKFVEGGLRDFSISRLKEKMPWGVPVPGDPEHVMYVWFDALTNYISTLGWPEDKDGLFERYWVNGTPTQYCGKDNTRFQAAMWQAMLMAAGVPNSHQVVVDGFITGEGGVRMSKTLGNVVDPKTIADEYGTEALRYFLLGEVSSFEDSPFTIERFKEAYNAKLANGLGNLVSRIMALSEKYMKDKIDERVAELITIDAKASGFRLFLTDPLSRFDMKSACDYIWNQISNLDKKIAEEEAYKVLKDDKEKGGKFFLDKNSKGKHVGYLFDLAVIAYELKPFLPNTSQKIIETIKKNKKPETPLFPRKD